MMNKYTRTMTLTLLSSRPLPAEAVDDAARGISNAFRGQGAELPPIYGRGVIVISDAVPSQETDEGRGVLARRDFAAHATNEQHIEEALAMVDELAQTPSEEDAVLN